MPSLDEVYRKFGETAEAGQLLETELGTMLLFIGSVEQNVIRLSEDGIEIEKNPARATALLNKINRQTFGQLLKSLKNKISSFDALEALLWKALEERNRLQHSFYRQHNFRRNSDEGRALMLSDLESIHNTLLNAYRAVMLLSGTDLDSVLLPLPTAHVPI